MKRHKLIRCHEGEAGIMHQLHRPDKAREVCRQGEIEQNKQLQ
ncbi:hypothetical protein [Hymenobacter qilianensis]|nr:hypothetical protein [Hymenobacter qilianensis]